MARSTFEDKALQGCAQNSVTIGAGLLPDPVNERLFHILGAATAPALSWDTAQRASLKCAKACGRFIASQADGQSMVHVSEGGRRQGSSGGEIVVEDDFADIFPQLSWHLRMERLKRGLFIVRGWPWSASRLLSTSPGGARTGAMFLQDKANFETLQQTADLCEVGRDMLRRHMFQKASVRQLCLAAEETRGQRDAWLADLVQVVRQHAGSLCQRL